MTSTPDYSLLDKANKLTDEIKIPLIPIRRETKKPALETWTDRREKKQLATSEERREWFENNKHNLGMIFDDRYFGLDIDGSESKRIFWQVLLSNHCSESLCQKVTNTWRVMTPGGGEHLVFERTENDIKISSRVYGSFTNCDQTWDHDLLEVIAYPKYMIQGGYQTENREYRDVTHLRIEVLDTEELGELLRLLQMFRVLVRTTTNIAERFKDFYHNNHRNNICWTLSGFLFKYGCPDWLVSEIITRLWMYYKDRDPLQDRLSTVKSTCYKDPDSAEVSGYDKLLEILNESYSSDDKEEEKEQIAVQTITKISGIMEETAIRFKFNWKRGYSHTDTQPQEHADYYKGVIDELPDGIKEQLNHHVYNIIRRNPLTFIIADKFTKQITKVVIQKRKSYNQNKDTKTTTYQQYYTPTDIIIDAIPHLSKVTIYKHPIKNSETYKITFQSIGDSKPFTIGPTTLETMLQELQKKRKVVKRLEAPEALALIITAYEKSKKAQVLEEISEPGFYWIDDKIVGYGITQRLDFDPWNNQDHKLEALTCTKIFDEWQERNKKKVALPSALKWTTLGPFAFITKTHSRGVDKWLPSLYLYQTTDTGKTTLIRDAVLGSWGLYADGENSDIYFKGPGSLDSPSKFGIAASQSTLVTLGDEIGNMFNDNDRYGGSNLLLDMQKFAVQNKYIRMKFNDNILALTSFAFTSNDPPPNDGAARRRFFAMQFVDNEGWTPEEKIKYEKWMNEVVVVDESSGKGKSRREIVSVYGDFVASYVIKNPDLILGYSSYTWHEPATIILKEFYKSAGVEPSKWLDLLAEQTIVREAKEERQFELRGFLRQCITKSYKENLYAIPDSHFTVQDSYGNSIRSTKEPEFKDILDYCLRNKTVQFLHRIKRNHDLEEDIAITSNIKSEMKKQDRNLPSVTMETIAAKIPGFSYDSRWINKEKIRVVCGPISKFREYLDYNIEEK